MVTVRYPSGLTLTYNNASKVYWKQAPDRADICYKSGDTEYLAAVVFAASGALIEWQAPCNIRYINTESAIDNVLNDLKGVRGAKLAELKTRLEKFNRQTWTWKE